MAMVTLRYGPYEAYGIVRHRPQRLYGLKGELMKLGLKVALVPSLHRDRLEIEMAGRKIFRCRLTYLKFNMDCSCDIVCLRAIYAVRDAYRRLYMGAPELVLPEIETINAMVKELLGDLIAKVAPDVRDEKLLKSLLDLLAATRADAKQLHEYIISNYTEPFMVEPIVKAIMSDLMKKVLASQSRQHISASSVSVENKSATP